MLTQAPKGTKDVLPSQSAGWQYIESVIRGVCAEFGFNEVRTPVFEHTELFLRGVGGTTDIVQKEMYTFTDKGDRSITLKPEGTAGVVRMFVEGHLFNEAQPTKMYYLNCPVFRYEKPQAGRLREHHQFGIEVFGAPQASIDAECIALALTLYKRLGIGELELRINSIGCQECRPRYNKALRAFFEERKSELCPTCLSRLEKNPLRILDCKEEKCRAVCEGAPSIIDYLCDDCTAHFERLKAYLTALDIEYTVDPNIVRGLDYYTKTVFEIVTTYIGAQGAVCAGGRYDRLVEEIGGPSMPGVGFGMGMERLLLVAEAQGIEFPSQPPITVYVAPVGDEASLAGFKLLQELRGSGVTADIDHVGRSFKAQFKYAAKLGARYVAVIGQVEVEASSVKLKNMATGEEKMIAQAELVAYILNV